MLPDIQILNFNSLIERAEVHFKPKAKVKEKIAVIFFLMGRGKTTNYSNWKYKIFFLAKVEICGDLKNNLIHIYIHNGLRSYKRNIPNL